MFGLAFWSTQLVLLVKYIGIVLLGALLHELGHFVIGWLSGGGVYIDQWSLIIPSRVNFRAPHAMSNLQVRLVGGWPYVFFPIIIYSAWHQMEYLLLFAVGGGFSISASDLNAVLHPEFWKRMTAGETIRPEDYQ